MLCYSPFHRFQAFKQKSVPFTWSVAITQKSLKQWEVNGKGIIAVFYVPFLLCQLKRLELFLKCNIILRCNSTDVSM